MCGETCVVSESATAAASGGADEDWFAVLEDSAVTLPRLAHTLGIAAADSHDSGDGQPPAAAPSLPCGRFVLAEIALASTSTTILGFGAVDLVAETGSDLSWDSLLYTRSQVVLAASEARIEALDTVWIKINDQDGLAEESLKARALGFSGKAAIHPSQVAPINAAFSPTYDEVATAKRIIKAASGDYSGAVQVDGKMIDEPVVIAARRTLARAEQIAAAS